ncbi:unnamed protein product [Rangifer tarandus platyrhynchus]|uniref:Uncharacterized protein n=1 Tax=Rangifer tarandus platyrhynchus TaxID=3082113 RepID=A0AC59YER2_RANTA
MLAFAAPTVRRCAVLTGPPGACSASDWGLSSGMKTGQAGYTAAKRMLPRDPPACGPAGVPRAGRYGQSWGAARPSRPPLGLRA